MAKATLHALVAEQKILNRIYVIRGQKVMLDRDLAEMYGVETKQLKRQVNRNTERFPKDFMFTLTAKEFENLRSQFGTSSWGGTRYMPMAFTEQGVAMLSSILNSKTAIEVNIRIIRVFTRLREYALTHKDILLQLSQLEKEVKNNTRDIDNIFAVLKELIETQSKSSRRNVIGFKNYNKER
ncbi:ORF6N domain-containing protein [Niabella sp. 22666]|uniref:ORF6N domain-containing protein n=1 Tax=Niabella sp. 22666 TaxID=3453954 RepID=UPI003F8625FA